MLQSLYNHAVVLTVTAFQAMVHNYSFTTRQIMHTEMCIAIYQCYLITKRLFFLHKQQLSLTCASIWRGRDVGTQGAVEAGIAGSRHIGHASALTVVTWKFSTNTSATVAHKVYKVRYNYKHIVRHPAGVHRRTCSSTKHQPCNNQTAL